MEGTQHSQPLEQGGLATPSQHIDLAMAADAARESAAFAELTGQRLRPELSYGRRFASYLAVGEVAIEPALGPARVAAVDPDGDMVTVTWKDDHGPGTATGRYSTDQVFNVRLPGPQDRILIQQQVDRAVWHRGDIPSGTARLIASHLHLGPRSVLFRFAIDGGILDDRLYDELDSIKKSRPAFEPWIHALARYCLSRSDTNPIPGWIPHRPEPVVGGRSNDAPGASRSRTPIGRYLTRTTVEQLLDAAFDLGVVAARSGGSRSMLGRLARVRTAAMVKSGRMDTCRAWEQSK